MNNSIHVVCGNCQSINRVPAEKLLSGGKCGACSHALFPGEVLEFNQEQFNRHIRKSDIPIVVDFWASWCGPCKMMQPIFKQAASMLEPHCRLAKVNTEQFQALAAQYQIRSIPSLLIFKDGKEIARSAGVMDQGQLISWVKRYL